MDKETKDNIKIIADIIKTQEKNQIMKARIGLWTVFGTIGFFFVGPYCMVYGTLSLFIFCFLLWFIILITIPFFTLKTCDKNTLKLCNKNTKYYFNKFKNFMNTKENKGEIDEDK